MLSSKQRSTGKLNRVYTPAGEKRASTLTSRGQALIWIRNTSMMSWGARISTAPSAQESTGTLRSYLWIGNGWSRFRRYSTVRERTSKRPQVTSVETVMRNSIRIDRGDMVGVGTVRGVRAGVMRGKSLSRPVCRKFWKSWGMQGTNELFELRN